MLHEPASHPTTGDSLDEAERVLLDAIEEGGSLHPELLERLCAERPDLAGPLCEAHRAFVAVRAALGDLSAPLADTPSDPVEPIAGRFQPLGEIGRGGMSIVLSAWDRQLRRKLALKCVRAPAPIGAEPASHLERRRARLVNEAQVLAQLDHPGIVPVFDVVRDGRGEVYVAMQRVRGADLRAVYRRHWSGDREWSLARVVGVLQRACEAVAYAHGKGVLHRDLKPANVMVGSFGETFVMDWGLARTASRARRAERPAASGPSTREADGSPEDLTASLSVVVTDRDSDAGSSSALYTQEGDVLGTPSYMSPEQAAGQLEAIDQRSDVYGAGAMLYELLARQAPYVRAGEARSSTQILADVRTAPPEPLHSAARQAPAELVAIAQKAMAREPARRYATMRDLADDLRAFLEGRVVRAHGTGAWSEARKWIGRHRGVVVVLSLLLVTVLVAAVTFALLYRESERRRTRLQVAQLDAQRRINALSGFGFAGAPARSFRDEFDGPQLHRRWTCIDGCDQVSLSDGALVLRSAGRAQHPTMLWIDPHVAVVHGDFDVRVAFRLDGFELPDEPRGGRVACLQVVDRVRGQILAAIGREVEREPNPVAPWEHSYRSYDHATADSLRPEHCAPADDRSGVLRVTRVGADVCAWYWQDGWRALLRAQASVDPVSIVLYARNWYAAEPCEFVVESVELVTDPASAVAEVATLAEDFDGGPIDPRFDVLSRSAIAAQVDGRLFLETFAGVEGRVELRLDPLRWRLAPQFELELDYALESLDVGRGQGASRVRLQATGLDGTNMGSITFEAALGGRAVVGYHHREEQRRPLERGRGRLRMERTGTTLRLALDGPAGWDVLVERPHVDEALALGFSLIVESPAGSPGVVAAFDRLRVSALRPR